MKLQLPELQEFIKKAISWYWEYGAERATLQPTWVAQLYKSENICNSIANRSNDQKKNIVIWGPSQVGKSTLLAYYLDSEDGNDSAIEWDKASQFVYRPSDNKEKSVFNPYNGGGDGSGCVIRMEMVDKVADKNHPVRVKLCDKTQLMQILTSGYLWECHVDSEENPATIIDKTFIERISQHAHATDSTIKVNKQALEFLLQATETISTLKDNGNQRWQKITSEENWQRIESSILSNKSLTTNIQNARRFVYEILWDNQTKLNEIFESLEKQLDKLLKYHDKPIYCSLGFAAGLADISTFSKLQPNRQDQSHLLTIYTELSIVDKGDFYTIEKQDNEARLFSTPEDFAQFQSLVWELHLPLREGFLEQRSEVVKKLLTEAVLFDVPGLPKAEKGDNLIDLQSEIDEGTIYTRVLKRGRTFSIIYRYSKELNIDSILLLSKASDEISKPMEISRGIKSMWSAIDKNYQVGYGKPPIPLTLCLTFFAKLYDDAITNNKYNFNQIDDVLDSIGNIPDVAQTYVTTSPWLRDGRIGEELRTENNIKEFIEKCNGSNFAQKRLRTEASKQSVAEAIQAKDGGFSYFFQQLHADVASVDLEPLRNQLIQHQFEQFNQSIAGVIPQQNDSLDYHEALQEFIGCIDEKLRQKLTADYDPALDVAIHLKNIFSFDAESFEMIPENLQLNESQRLTEYLNRQLSTWTRNSNITQSLIGIGLDYKQHSNFISAVKNSIKFDEKLTRLMISVLNNITDRWELEHARHYVATAFANYFYKPNTNTDIEKTNTDIKHAQERYASWMQTDREAQDSPHYVKIIEPIKTNISILADALTDMVQPEQVGDEQILALFNEWNDKNGGQYNV